MNQHPPAFANHSSLQQAAAHKNSGNEYFKQQEFMEAAICYTQAIVDWPQQTLTETDPVLYTNRAMCFEKLSQWHEMESDARKSIELKQSNPKGFFLLGKALLQKALAHRNEKSSDFMAASIAELEKGWPE